MKNHGKIAMIARITAPHPSTGIDGLEQATETKALGLNTPTWDDGECYDVSFAVHKSRRYHSKMRDFYRGCHNFVVASTALTGTSAFVVILTNAPVIFAEILTGMIAVTATLDLVLGFSKRADHHELLCRRFTDLAAQMIELQPTAENYRRACAERLKIETDESTERRLVDLQAQNEEARARGVSPEDLVPLSALQCRFGYIATFGMRRLEIWDAQRNAAGKSPAC